MSRESIWFGLDRFGFSDTAKAAIMGNAQQESGNETNRVQGDFSADRKFSWDYTVNVNDDVISRSDFVYHGPNGGGYGWLQWTWPGRKAGLYDLTRGRGVSISDETAALDFFWKELNTSEFAGVLSMLRSDASLRDMTEYFMVHFEKPDDQSQGAKNVRVRYAEEIYNEFHGREEEPEPPAEDQPETPFWPPRVLCVGMTGADVQLLQALLLCHGFNPGGCSGIFDNRTRNMVVGYQAQNGLDQDGIAGPKTFRALGVSV